MQVHKKGNSGAKTQKENMEANVKHEETVTTSIRHTTNLWFSAFCISSFFTCGFTFQRVPVTGPHHHL